MLAGVLLVPLCRFFGVALGSGFELGFDLVVSVGHLVGFAGRLGLSLAQSPAAPIDPDPDHDPDRS